MNSETIKLIDHLYIRRTQPRIADFYWVTEGKSTLLERVPLTRMGLSGRMADLVRRDEQFSLSKLMISYRPHLRMFLGSFIRRGDGFWLRIDPGDRLLAAVPWEE